MKITGTVAADSITTTGNIELASGASVSKSTALDAVTVTGDATITGANTVNKNTVVTLASGSELTLGSSVTAMPKIEGAGTLKIARGTTIGASDNGEMTKLGEMYGTTATVTATESATINVKAPTIRVVGDGKLAGFNSNASVSSAKGIADTGSTTGGFINVVLDCVKAQDKVKAERTTSADPKASSATWTAVSGVLGNGNYVADEDGLQAVMLEGDKVTGLKFTVTPKLRVETAGETTTVVYGEAYTIIFVIG